MKGWDEVFYAALKQEDTVLGRTYHAFNGQTEAINDLVKQHYRILWQVSDKYIYSPQLITEN